MSRKYRVCIADERPVLRGILRKLLGGVANLEVVGEADNSPELLWMVQYCRPELVIADADLPGGAAVPIIEALRLRSPEIKILVLTQEHDGQLESAVFRAGAQGCFSSGRSIAEFLGAVQTILGGGLYGAREISGALVGHFPGCPGGAGLIH